MVKEIGVKEIIEYLEKNGFKEITEEDKKTDWYKQLSKPPECFYPDKKIKEDRKVRSKRSKIEGSGLNI